MPKEFGSELSGGTFSQGMMLSAMNAVTVWVIEQSIAPNAVKTGGASSEKANTSLVVKEEYVLLAKNDDGTVTEYPSFLKPLTI